MSPTKFSLRNPLVITAVMLALVVFGIYSYANMGIGVVPNISFPGVTIITTDAGADPATIETQITKPIEDAVSGLANIDQMTSTSNEGISAVTVQFTTAANSELVPVDVERVVNSVRSKLPAEADPPSITKFETSQIPVIVVTLSGPQPLDQIQQVANDRVQRIFEGVSGVAGVALSGGPVREVHVKVDLDKLQSRGLGLNSVQQALQSEQIELPAGSLTAAGKDVNVRFTGLVKTPAELGSIIVAQQPAGPVYVRDVATIDDSIKKTTTISRVDGVPTVTLTVTKLASASSIQVSHDIRQQMAILQPQLPSGMKFDVGYDVAQYTQSSFNTIQKTLFEAVIFTGLILLLLLHTWRSTLIVLISIPTSVLTTFGFMNLLGMNLNLFSMLALTLAVGILVDDSIVVLENIYRHLGLGEPPWIAAVNGRQEIGLAAITITSVDIAVYLPIALIPGISGEFIRPFALVIAAATLTSLAVSFTLTPLLASRYLRMEHALKQGGGWLNTFGRKWDGGFERLGHIYSRLLRRVLMGKVIRFGRRGRPNRRGIGGRWAVILAGLLSLVLGVAMLGTGRIGFDIFPSGDQSEVDLTIVMPPATTLFTTDGVVKELETRLKKYPEVRQVISTVGASVSNGSSITPTGDTALMRVLLVKPTERKRSAAALADDMGANLGAGIPGLKVRTGLQNAFGFGGFGSQPIQVAVRGPNPDVLNGLVEQVTAAVRAVPGASDINNVNDNVQPEYVISVDRDKAADLGITAQQASAALRTAVDGTVVSKFRQPGQDDIDIRLLADDAFRATPDNLAGLPLLSSKGTIVSLGQVGTVTSGAAPTEIDHVNRDRSVIVNASTSGRLVGDVQRDVETNVAKITLPPGYSIQYYGQAQQGGDAFASIYKAIAIGMVLIYMLMMMLFGSVTLPLAVMMSLPLAVVGSFGAMAITETPFTLFSLLGFTLLVGLVGKNAILLVDFTDTLRKRGYSRTDALLEAGPTRLRPIVMTTMSIIVALLPVAAGIEEGSELLKAAAIVLIGGLITSTLLTLVFVPSMYTIFDDFEAWIKGLFRKVSPGRELTPAELELAGRLHMPNGNGHAPEPAEDGEVLAARV
ncbi:MAG: efflux RND transporter permease subunit [Chloroflexi bacterium]|nr:efflux RND transporter permease subunit [Chloroflexota bacterium]